jgi:hypothetical protein
MNNYTEPFKDATFVSTIGKGSQAVVNKYILNNKFVAVKNFNPTPEGNIDASALKEINSLKKLVNCPHVVQLLDVDIRIENFGIIVRMLTSYYIRDLENFIYNTDLQTRLQYYDSILNQLLAAINNLHFRGIIHCDIKPANILMDEQYNVYLADFGLSIQLPCDITYRTIYKSIEGTPLYKAPELLVNHHTYTNNIDIWALGLTMLEYLIKVQISEPRALFLENNTDDNFSIMYELLQHITQPLDAIIDNYNRIKNYEIHDAIHVQQLLNTYIPNNNIDTTILTSMLQINPRDRLNIEDLKLTNLCYFNVDVLERGALHTDTKITLLNYYTVLYTMIHAADLLGLKIYTLYTAIDLMERYCANFPITDIKRLNIVSATCLVLLSKFYESEDIDYNTVTQYYEYVFTVKELKYMEILLLKRVNYILTSCSYDDIIDALNNFTKSKQLVKQLINIPDYVKFALLEKTYTYPLLVNTYKSIQQDGLYPGDMFPFEFVEYIDKVKK